MDKASSSLRAVIFDMDGTLIDSEPFWKIAEKEVFSAVGADYCEKLAAKTATMTTGEVTEFWYQRKAWSSKSLEDVEKAVIESVKWHINNQGKALNGVIEVLTLLQNNGIKIGLATNSPSSLIKVVLNKLDITHFFTVTISAEQYKQGKPSPEVYLAAAQKLAMSATQCVAVEDSYTGLLAAHRANMLTVAVPSPEQYHDSIDHLADLKLHSLEDFNENCLAQLNNLRQKALRILDDKRLNKADNPISAVK